MSIYVFIISVCAHACLRVWVGGGVRACVYCPHYSRLLVSSMSKMNFLKLNKSPTFPFHKIELKKVQKNSDIEKMLNTKTKQKTLFYSLTRINQRDLK